MLFVAKIGSGSACGDHCLQILDRSQSIIVHVQCLCISLLLLPFVAAVFELLLQGAIIEIVIFSSSISFFFLLLLEAFKSSEIVLLLKVCIFVLQSSHSILALEEADLSHASQRINR